MLKAHTVYAIALVSQSTSALLLSLLAWTDRRSRWLVPLAGACALHAIAVYLTPLWRGTGRWIPQSFSAAILVAMLYLIHLGLQSLVDPLRSRFVRVHALMGGLMAVLVLLAFWSSLACILGVSLTASVLLAWTAQMLWNAQVRELRSTCRATAMLLVAIVLQFVVRAPFEVIAPKSPILLFLRELTVLSFTAMAFSFLAIYAAETRRRLHVESRLDALTGLLNRRAVEESAAHHLKRAARTGKPCALLMVDLDHFKRLNDTWGHDLGDRALLITGELLRRTALKDKNCEAARMGGEEFAVLLYGWRVDGARTLAERLCADVAALRLTAGTAEIGFTASVGVSILQSGETNWTEMLRRADVALYRAKRDGRNRVAICSEAALTGLSAGAEVTTP